MKAIIALASALSMNAEIVAKIHRLPNGFDEVKLRNNGGSSLTAFVFTVKQMRQSVNTSSAPHVLYSDPLIDSGTKPLAAGEERTVMVNRFFDHRGKPYPLQEPVVAAGIFADGSTTGDASLLTRLMLRRSSMLLAVETALETLMDAGRRNIQREQLVKQFSKMAEFTNRWYLPPEQRVGREVYQSIAGKLINLPQQQIGEPFPPSSFVEQEAAALNRQRVTLSESQPSLADQAFIERRLDPTLAPKGEK